jgi:hypothetical protein
MTIRILALSVLFLIGMLAPVWVAVPCALCYAFWVRAYELIPLAMVIDAYFGVAASAPYYTLAATLVVVVMELVKPHLAVSRL